ncbi:MAG: GntR family transcriptional regulator [Lachnospiraceae bacterium]|nr:GntR family transcriptional regulator [Lachnospiraceae bacterium]
MKNINEEYSLLSTKAYEEIKRSIVEEELKGGERLTESKLSDLLGVSRTPIREALRRLNFEGYISMTPNYGFAINELTEDDMREILEVRRALEGEAARMAAQRITGQQKESLTRNFQRIRSLNDVGEDKETHVQRFMTLDVEFHHEILSIAGNSRFISMEESLQDRLYRLRFACLSVDESIRECTEQHERILNAILDGNAEAADFYSREHLIRIQNLSNRLFHK